MTFTGTCHKGQCTYVVIDTLGLEIDGDEPVVASRTRLNSISALPDIQQKIQNITMATVASRVFHSPLPPQNLAPALELKSSTSASQTKHAHWFPSCLVHAHDKISCHKGRKVPHQQQMCLRVELTCAALRGPCDDHRIEGPGIRWCDVVSWWPSGTCSLDGILMAIGACRNCMNPSRFVCSSP